MSNKWLDFYASLGFNLAKLAFYALLIPGAFMLGWVESNTFISLLSIVALVESSGSAVVTAILRDETNNQSQEDSNAGTDAV